jgi:hypothetical protein
MRTRVTAFERHHPWIHPAGLALCDGSRAVAEIVTELSRTFPNAPIATEVPGLLTASRREGWLK